MLLNKIDVDYQLAERLQAQEQEELFVEENTKLFQQLLEQRRKHFAAKFAEEKRNKPPTQAQQRKIMCTYLKKMEGKKLKDLKNKSFDNIQKIFKRAGEELEHESTKKQKVDEDKDTAELQSLMEVIPDEEEVAIDVVPLATKSPKIVDWKIHKEGKKNLEDLYKLVKARYGSTRPVESMDYLLWNDLKTKFKPHSMQIYMLVEKRYPLTPPTITYMLNKNLQERIVGIKSLLNAASITAAHIRVNVAQLFTTASTKVTTVSTKLMLLKELMLLVKKAELSTIRPSLAHEDLQQIHPDDIKEMDLRWQMAMLTMRAKSFLKNTGGKITVNGNETIGFSLNKLIECQIVDNCKKGLGYEKYNAVPPLYTGNFMPPTPDLSFSGLDEFVNKPVVNNRKSDEEVSKVVRKSDDSPIIEDWGNPQMDLQDQGVIDMDAQGTLTVTCPILTNMKNRWRIIGFMEEIAKEGKITRKIVPLKNWVILDSENRNESIGEMKGNFKEQFSVAITPNKMGVLRGGDRILIESARTMPADSKLPTTFWKKAVNNA
ncbi:hypothetical protein Tco_1502904 [Tanacetum coccineum]